jgi:O-antigen ligase
MNTTHVFGRGPFGDAVQRPVWWIVAVGLVSVAAGFVISRDLPLLLIGYVIVAAGVALLAFTRPEYAAAVLLVINWGNFGDVLIRYHGLPSIVKPLVALLFLVVIVQRFGPRRKPLVSDPVIWCVLAYVLITALGLLYARYTGRVEYELVELLKDTVTFFILINLLGSRAAFERMVWMLLAVGALLGTLAVYQEITKTYDWNYGGLALNAVAQIAEGMSNRARAAGTIGDPNFFGQQLVVLVPLGLWAALNGRTWRGKFFGAYATLACLAGIGLSFSRGAYLATIVVLVLYAMYVKLDPRYLLVLPLIGALLWVAPPEFRARFDTLDEIIPGANLTGTYNDDSIQGRSVKIAVGLAMFGDHPFLGVGRGNYRLYYPDYIRRLGGAQYDTQRDAHNLYLGLAAEQGLLGLAAFGGLIATAIWRIRRARRWFSYAGEQRMADLSVALIVGFAGYLVTAIFLHGAYLFFLWLQLAMIVAMATIARGEAAGEAWERVTARSTVIGI